MKRDLAPHPHRSPEVMSQNLLAMEGGEAPPQPLSPPLWRQLCQRPMVLFAIIVIIVLVGSAIFAPWIAPYSPEQQFDTGLTNEGGPVAPNSQFLLGTDTLGRDLLSRLIYGARATLLVGIVANGAAVLIGVVVGVGAAYLRGPVGGFLMRFTDLMAAFPALLLALVLTAIFRPSLWIVALVIAAVNWVQIARVLYSETLSLVEREFILAAQSLGAGGTRIFWRHILPQLLPTLIVWATLGIATSALFEALLSFLGVGVQPPTPSWGNIANENQAYFGNAPWLVFFPGLAIALLALAFNILGDALRDASDPNLQGRF
jgi:peptide/nickel transport system permease protein